MGCGASSAAGDKAIVTATKIDPPSGESQAASQKPVEELSAGTSSAEEQSTHPAEAEKSPKESHSPPPDVSSSAQAKAPKSEPEAPSKLSQNIEVKQDDVKPAEPAKLAPKEAAVDPSKDPFAKPVLPTAVPLHPAAPSSPAVAASSAGTPTPATEAPGSKSPGSVVSTPKPADSPVPGTPVREPAAESKTPGPSNLSKSSGAESERSKTEQEVVHTPRAATEAAIEALMDDVSAAH
ncbi:hypothetical protein KFL_000080130 [Klebsormidium nitens]|uniref:Uncharacterized protein n=1 Tax=Klebsormidium nitens TaxID=105231 RepID=A0A1Y1HLR6_KLENI|nr:hypothetical protein KFL_000080130 [Klebsormidium nitens]|eukprot:GAQ78109.1 hypothetical protein KFL_000080130 [Klebsormidium nitens]